MTKKCRIKRDGKVVATVDDNKVMEWFHKHTPTSQHHAMKHEGYSVDCD